MPKPKLSIEAQTWERRRDERNESYAQTRKFLEGYYPELYKYQNQIPRMEARCKMAICVPAYREGANIISLLESIAEQNLPKNTFEIIILVNNSPEEATKMTQAFEKNQNLITFLKGIPKKTRDAFILNQSEGLARTWENPLSSEIRVHTIDASSAAYAIPHCNVGKARDLLGAIATQRFFDNMTDDGIIIMTDADCTFREKTFLETLQESFAKNPDLAMATGNIATTPENSSEAQFTMHAVQEIDYLLWDIMNVMDKNLHPEERRLQTFEMGGARMYFRANTFVTLGGIPPLAGSEDTFFGYSAENRGLTIASLPITVSTVTRPSDRADAAFSFGGSVQEAAREAENLLGRSFMARKIERDLATGVEKNIPFDNVLQRNPALDAILTKEEYEEMRVAFNKKLLHVRLYPNDYPDAFQAIKTLRTTIQARIDAKYPPTSFQQILRDLKSYMKRTLGEDWWLSHKPQTKLLHKLNKNLNARYADIQQTFSAIQTFAPGRELVESDREELLSHLQRNAPNFFEQDTRDPHDLIELCNSWRTVLKDNNNDIAGVAKIFLQREYGIYFLKPGTLRNVYMAVRAMHAALWKD